MRQAAQDIQDVAGHFESVLEKEEPRTAKGIKSQAVFRPRRDW